jgi:hypothetical protein
VVSDCNPSTSTSHEAGITILYHHSQLVCWDEDSITFFWAWPWRVILLISTSWVAGIVGVYHHTWPLFFSQEFWAEIVRLSWGPCLSSLASLWWVMHRDTVEVLRP